MNGFETNALMGYRDRASDSDWADVLAGFPLFSGLGKRRLRKLVRRAEVTEFAPGEAVIARNDSLYVILGGAAKAIGTATAPPLGIGDYFGELSILDGGPRSATVLAAGELHVMRLPGRLFLELAERSPGVALRMLQDLGARFRQLEPI